MNRGPDRPGYDWVRDRIYSSAGPLPQVSLEHHEHMCPDGTSVRVIAQFIATTGVTLYRWHIDGEPTRLSSAIGPATDPPDWSTVDSEHPVTEWRAS